MRIPARLQPYLFAALACVCLAGFAAYDLLREKARSVSQAKANTANLAKLLEAHSRQNLHRVESVLREATARLDAAGARPTATPDLQVLRAALNAGLPGDGLVNDLTLISADASPAVRSAGAGATQDGLARPPGELRWLEQPASTLRVAAPVSGADGVWLLPVALQAGAGQQRPHASVVAWVNLRTLQPVLNAVDTGRNGFITLFLSNGWMLATAPRNDALLAKNWGDTPMFKEHLPRLRADTVQQVVVRDGTERIYSYRALADYPVVVATGISMTDALADWRARAWWDAVLLTVAAAASMLGATAISRTYVRRAAAERTAVQAREAAERSERFLRAITDNLPMRIAYADRGLRYRFLNRAHADRFGVQRDAALGRQWHELAEPGDAAALGGRLEGVLAGQAQHFESEEQHDGLVRTVETHLIPDIDPNGHTQGFYASSADVTERLAQRHRIQEALAERETLLREVYHRVKNNLQVIQSLLNLQRRALPEGVARAALEESVQRIHAMALVHEMLYQSGNLQAVDLRNYTAQLLAQLSAAAGADSSGIVVASDVDPIEAALELAVPYGLLVTELVTNSLKHAFIRGHAGHIQVQLRRTDGAITLQVRDNGRGLADGFAIDDVTSMGLQLAASLATQLGGRLQAANASGAVFSATLHRLA